MQQLPLACFLSLIRPPGITFEDGFLQILPVDKAKCPFVKDHSDITIRLYTRHNPVVYQELKIDDDESLFASNMDFNDPTVIYFTAFLEQPDDGSGLSVREAYMLRGDTNFIILDLSRLEAGPWYFTAAENTWYIGNFAAKFIDYLVSRGLDLKKLHLVGHSLGAQSAGVAGAVIKSGRISRITGLDPAFPLFDKLPLAQRLDPSDAEFVDVIHTDAGIFGFNRPTGQVDFYPNGGISPQPGCELEAVLHEQRLLNNCDRTPQALGFYIFFLETNKKQNRLEDNIVQFFQHINNLKKSNANNHDPQDLNTEVSKSQVKANKDDIKQRITETEANKRDKTVKYYETKQNQFKQNPRFEKQKHYTLKQLNMKSYRKEVTTLENLDTINTLTYKREKRISTVDNNTPIKEINRDDNNINVRTTEFNEHQKNIETNDIHRKDCIKSGNKTKDLNLNEELSKDADTEIDETNPRDTLKRHKRFISLFRNNNNNDDNFLLKMLEFLVKNRKNVIPIVTVMREINTLVKSANGELNHSSKEKNNFIGTPPLLTPVTYDLELGNDSKALAFVKRLLGLGVRGGKLTVNGSGK